MIARLIDRFFKVEQLSGLLLLGATMSAIFLANSPAKDFYHHILHYEIGDLVQMEKSIHHWINDGLMVIFFLLAGLEIRREFVEGELRDIKRAALPFAGAAGGMLFPALFYVLINARMVENWSGWAIPSATDIAFAIALLTFVSRGLPSSLRLFLLALAILDDIGAIIIIALFYAGDLDFSALLLAGILLVLMSLLRWKKIGSRWPYYLLGAILWVALSKSGVHATLSGIMIAFLLPSQPRSLNEVEEKLHPWTAYLILPLFALANAGLDLSLDLGDIVQPIPLGIFLGLFLGKQMGVMVGAMLAVKMGWAHLPRGANWKQLHGVAILTGVGFTMSLFIGLLAFPNEETQNAVRLGVMMGSLASAIAGLIWLRWLSRA